MNYKIVYISYMKIDKDDFIKKYLPDLINKNICAPEPPREQRRDPNSRYVKELEKIDLPVFDDDSEEISVKFDHILFVGFGFYDCYQIFMMEKLLLPLYVSYKLNMPVFLDYPPKVFIVDYKKGVYEDKDTYKKVKLDLVISRSNALNLLRNKFLLYRAIKIVITPVNTFKQRTAHKILPNDYLTKCPSPIFSNMLKTYGRQFERHNFILFLGSVYNEKGQKEFIDNVDATLIKDYTILFVGKIMNGKYLNYLQKNADKKGIKYVVFERIDAEFLEFILPRCKYQILYCSYNFDPNPRAIIEGLWAGLPYIVSSLVTIPIKIQKLGVGVICKRNDAIDLNSKLQELFKIEYGESIIKICEENLKINKIGDDIIRDLNHWYCKMKRI
jgi:glycosyltransferase involved in cell wall biosynthesis